MRSWIGTWAASAAAPVYFVPPEIMVTPTPLAGTMRHRLRISAGGRRVCLQLSNVCGTAPLPVGGVSIGLCAPAGRWQAERLHRLTFDGETGCVIPAGACVLSDPLELRVPPLAELLVSVYFPQAFTPARSEGVHWAGHVADVDRVMDLALPDAIPTALRPNVTLLAVEVDRPCAAVVCLGDSLTDGAGSSSLEFRSWTDVLARRLQARHGADAPAVVNAGIGGNQLLGSLIGPSALDRLEGDVLAVPGVSHLVVFEGINDIGAGGRMTMEGKMRPLVSAPEMIDGYRQILARSRARGISVIGATLPPFRGGLFFTEGKEPVRLAVNDWIKNSGAFDQVLDFDAVLHSAGEPSRLGSEFDSGDCLHPNADGQWALGQSIDLDIFE